MGLVKGSLINIMCVHMMTVGEWWVYVFHLVLGILTFIQWFHREKNIFWTKQHNSIYLKKIFNYSVTVVCTNEDFVEKSHYNKHA